MFRPGRMEDNMHTVLSVIIPIYKVEQYLRKCIESILTQDYKDVEVILVDDGSPDSSAAICDEYACKYANIKVIHKCNGGLSDARNTGIQAASGEYITFLDGDDYWNPECSLNEIMTTILQNQEIDVHIIDCIDEYPDGTRMTRAYRQALVTLSDVSVTSVYKKCIEIGDIFEAAYTKIVKRKFILQNQLCFKEGIIAEDNEWTFRVMRCANKIKFLPDTLVVYQARRAGSITNSVSFRSVRDLMTIVELSEEYYCHHPERITGLGEYELAHCAYLWCIALGACGGLKGRDREEAIALLKTNWGITKYAYCRKTKLSVNICRIFGIHIAASLLRFYIRLMQNNIVSNKTKVK